MNRHDPKQKEWRKEEGRNRAGRSRRKGEKRRQNYKKENDSAPSHAAAAASATSADNLGRRSCRRRRHCARIHKCPCPNATCNCVFQNFVVHFASGCATQGHVVLLRAFFVAYIVCLHMDNPHNECILSFLRICDFCCCSIIMWQSFCQPYLHLSGMRRDGVVVVRMLCRKNAGSVLPPRFRPNSRGT